MKTKTISFKNADGIELSARLELPVGTRPEYFAIFAHCFTCGKNSKAATYISRGLTQSGFGVLRFDFTGLGQSEGHFEDTHFATNIEDLIAAAQFLEEFYVAPVLLIGHSLGGTAVVHASANIDSVKAVCTIGAPAEAVHVLHLISEGRDEIERNGKAKVDIGGRPFTISNDFITELEKHETKSLLRKLRKAILIMHSPQDKVVDISNAADLYTAAFHPKSFISLDGADHLITDTSDAQYISNVLSAWVKRYIPEEQPHHLQTKNQTAVQLGAEGFTAEIVSGVHRFIADEPTSMGGNDLGPSPYQLLNAALGACTVMTMQMYARRKEWDLQQVTAHLDHERVYEEDMTHPESPKSKIDLFKVNLEIKGNLDAAQRNRLLEIAGKCPVHRTLTDTEIRIDVGSMEN